MKKTLVKVVLSVVLVAFAMALAGCNQHGETLAEGKRRHQRNLKVNQESLSQDIDAFMLYDKPSGLSYLRLPR